MVVANTDYPFVTGPSSAVDSDAASFDGTSGRVLKDAGSGAGNVTGPGSSTTNDLPKFADTTGKVLSDSGILASNVVQGPASATDGNLAVWNGATGKLLKDGGTPNAGLLQYADVKITTGTITTNSASFVDLTGVTVTLTTGAHRVLVILIGTCFNTNAAGGTEFFDIAIDTVRQGGSDGLMSTSGQQNTVLNADLSFMTGVLSAGSHTIKIQWRTTAANGNFEASSGSAAWLQIIETGLTT